MQSFAIGQREWAIADGYIPSSSAGSDPAIISHEAVCMLNAADHDAHVRIFAYFADRDPIGPFHVLVPARRTRHVRTNDLSDPEPIPRGTDYSVLIASDTPIVVQHTRLDSRPLAHALFSTIAFAGH